MIAPNLERLAREIPLKADKAVAMTAFETHLYLKEIIMSTDSVLTPILGNYEKGNRVDTGRMLNSINLDEVSDDQGTHMRVGWTETKRKYFLWQETGKPEYYEKLTKVSRNKEKLLKDAMEMNPMLSFVQGMAFIRNEMRKNIAHF